MTLREAERELWLATDGDLVFILGGPRQRASRYAGRNGLTILKSDEGELKDLAKRGAKITDVPRGY